ncbi:MAG: EamA family transporter, partial [Candidatus Lokiarchaeota archaeon]|nr:EamA family transporter [Candidatus Lokiarchaeota archaeon]
NLFNIYLLACALFLGLGCYIFSYYIWNSSQKKLDPSKVASFLYIEPFLTLLLSMLFQRSEIITILNVLGGLVVLIGIILVNYK